MIVTKWIWAMRCAVLSALTILSATQIFAALKEVTDDDTRYRSAAEAVRSSLKRNGLREGFDASKSRFVVVEEMRMTLDPVKDPNFVEKRGQLERQLFTQCHSKLSRLMATRFSSETVETDADGSDSTGKSNADQSTSLSSVSCMPIQGMQILHEADSYDGKEYAIAIAAIWSRTLQEDVRAIIAGKATRGKTTNVKFAEWVDQLDLSSPASPRFLYDEDGVLHVIGVGICSLQGNPKHDCISRAVARTRAMSAITRSIHVQCEGSEECSTALQGGRETNRYSSKTETKTDLYIAGMREVKCGEVSWLGGFGPKVFVSICEISSHSSAQASERERSRYEASVKASGNLSAALLTPCGGSMALGECVFSYRPGIVEFDDAWKKAFGHAFVQAVGQMTQGGSMQYRESVQSIIETGDSKRRRTGSRAVASQNECEINDNETDSGWESKMTISYSNMMDKNAELLSKGELYCQQSVPLIGDFSISQEDSYDPGAGTYVVRVRMTGTTSKIGTLSIDECIARTDFKKMLGPRRYRDKNGDLWLFGIGASDAEDLERAKSESAKDALRNLMIAAGVEFSAKECVVDSLNLYEDGLAGVAVRACLTRSVSALHTVRQRLLRAKKRKFAGADVHPLTGNKIYTTVYIVNTEGL